MRSSPAAASCGWVVAPRQQQQQRPQQRQPQQQRPKQEQQQQSQNENRPAATADAPRPTPLLLLKRRLPSLATAAWALLGGIGGAGIGTGFSLQPPAAHAATTAAAVTTSSSSSSSTPLAPALLLAGPTANSPAKPAVLLLPIAKIEAAIDEIGAQCKDPDRWQQALDTLSAPPFTKPEFKKTFNAYSDTIYRATSFNGYTSNPPSSQQSIQYLYRNEILTNLEELREELSYLIQERAKGSEGDWQDRSGLDDYWGRAKAAMNKYLSLAPPDDVQAVREAVANQRKQAKQE